MTVAEAAEQWIEAKKILDQFEPQLEASATVLKKYFKRTKKQDYRGRISYALTTYKAIDIAMLRAALGEGAQKYEVQRERETLSLLKR